MRIGVNALYLIPGGVGGTEIYLRSLLAALAEIDPYNFYFVFTNRETAPDLAPQAPNFAAIQQPVRAVSRPARIAWEQTALPIEAARLGLDLLWNPGFTAPLACPCPQVTTFHDLQHKRHPEYFRWWDLPFWNFFLFWAAQISRSIVAISKATAADLRRYYRLPDGKIRVVSSGVDPVFFDVAQRRRPEPLAGRHAASRRSGLSYRTDDALEQRATEERFLLTVSTLHPHKNLEGLLAAFAVFRRTHPEIRLVVCGMHGFATGAALELRNRLGLADAVEFPGWIPREDLYRRFASAWAFVYPSRFEGFGLPVLEALAAGVPTACSNIEPLASIAGDAALQFDPENTEAIADAMRRLTEDETLRARLAEAGPLRAAEFGWRSTAAEMLRVFEDAAE